MYVYGLYDTVTFYRLQMLHDNEGQAYMAENSAAADTSIMTIAEVAAYLKISETTVWRYCVSGKLPAFQVGRQWRIEQRDLEVWISKMKEKSEKSTPTDNVQNDAHEQ